MPETTLYVVEVSRADGPFEPLCDERRDDRLDVDVVLAPVVYLKLHHAEQVRSDMQASFPHARYRVVGYRHG